MTSRPSSSTRSPTSDPHALRDRRGLVLAARRSQRHRAVHRPRVQVREARAARRRRARRWTCRPRRGRRWRSPWRVRLDGRLRSAAGPVGTPDAPARPPRRPPPAARRRAGRGEGVLRRRDDRVRGREAADLRRSTTGRRDEWGFDEYACLGRRRPLGVGGVGSTTGTGSGATPVYAHAGRYLASYHQSDGEGGPSAHVSVVDLIRRRVGLVRERRVLRVDAGAAAGHRRHRGGASRPARACSSSRRAGARGRSRARAARDLAMYGGTVYWTEGGQPRSARAAGRVGRRGDHARAGAPAPPSAAPARPRAVARSSPRAPCGSTRRPTAARLPRRRAVVSRSRARRRRGSSATAGCSPSARAARAWSTRARAAP